MGSTNSMVFRLENALIKNMIKNKRKHLKSYIQLIIAILVPLALEPRYSEEPAQYRGCKLSVLSRWYLSYVINEYFHESSKRKEFIGHLNVQKWHACMF